MTQKNRRWLMYGIPLLAAVILAVVWSYSGRYISTDNAYVKSTQIHVSPEVSGLIDRVAVAENTPVEVGELLFTINRKPFLSAIAGIEARLEAIRIDIETQRAAYRQRTEELKLAEENLAFARREFQRQSNLSKKGMNAESQLDEALHAQHQAQQTLSVINEDIKRLLAGLQGDPELAVESHPRYQAVMAELEQAKLDLDNTRILSPIKGIASKTPSRGEYADAGKPVMSVVSTEKYWVEANMMETDLTKIHPGMPAAVKIDTYPDREWQGTVESISPATGAEFAILPPQNATGNWVKITQRIPVRISLPAQNTDLVLRKGMTAEVTVDTGTYH